MPARVKAAATATNPFRFGRIVSGDAFTDREADLLALERELRGGQNILMEAPRRFGKTSLILEVKRRLEAAGIPVAYLDCMLVPSRARLADRLAYAAIHRWIIEYNFSRQDERVMINQRYDTPEKLSSTDAEVIQWRRLVVTKHFGGRDAPFEYRNPDDLSPDAVPLDRVSVRYLQEQRRRSAR